MKTIIFDIETGPLPADQINIPPYEPPANIKDPAKIVDREEAYKREFIERAALDPLTGRVLAIGFKRLNGPTFAILNDDEAMLIADAIVWLEDEADKAGCPILVGFNSHSFDLPYLIRRCWANKLPTTVFRQYRSGRYWDDRKTIDLREVWQLGDRMAKGSLDAVCRSLGLGCKNGDGAQFADLLKSDPAKAVAYLEQDLALTEALYKRLVDQF